ncbi:hypothetical protein EVAR_24861_1 [Eumeta japonica]|uniref:Uncharacterized protein n=1 Tax=Eumeta variegata TaxID=151549 RepID=A0A4C1YA97_EUMVA|nr:hypothetical protein EVAR_24861_1 [Eumeta japonica]
MLSVIFCSTYRLLPLYMPKSNFSHESIMFQLKRDTSKSRSEDGISVHAPRNNTEENSAALCSPIQSHSLHFVCKVLTRSCLSQHDSFNQPLEDRDLMVD